MKSYELTYIISSKIDEEKASNLCQEVSNFVESTNGEVIRISTLKKTKLAYPINTEIIAYLTTLDFKYDPKKISELEKELKVKKDILRHIILIKKPIKPKKIKERKL